MKSLPSLSTALLGSESLIVSLMLSLSAEVSTRDLTKTMFKCYFTTLSYEKADCRLKS